MSWSLARPVRVIDQDEIEAAWAGAVDDPRLVAIFEWVGLARNQSSHLNG